MKIGIDYRMGGNMHAGIGRYISELLSGLLEIDQTNLYSVFYNQKNCDAAGIEALKKFPNVRLIPANIRHYSLSEQTKFLKILNSHNLTLVHFPSFNVPLFYRRPYVVTIHDAVHHKISGHKKSRYLKFLAYKKIIENAAKTSKKIITVSEAAKKDLVSILPVSPAKIEVTYEGANVKPVGDEQVKKVKQSFLLTRPYFLCVGTLERKKNIVSLARAFDVFLEKYKLDMDLVIAGKPDAHYPEIKYQAMEIKHKNRLVFTDFIEDSQLAALYEGAYAYVSASLHEGFGLPGVEAMKFGLPLLVSNTEVFNEVYDNAAIYFNPTDISDIAEKMKLLAADPEFRQQMQEKSLERSSFFDWKKTARQTLAVYVKAAAGIAEEV